MSRRLATILLVLIMTFFLSTTGFARPTNSAKQSVDGSDIGKYQILTPEGDMSTTIKKIVLISGKAPKDTDIKIDVYGAIDLTGKNYTLEKLPDDESYTLISSESIKSGAIGFGEEVELILGVNKIVISFGLEGIPEVEKILYRYEMSQAVKNLKNPAIKSTAK